MSHAPATIAYALPPRSSDHARALDSLFARVGELSALPGVAQRVIAVASDEDSDVDDLAHVVEQDPTLTVRILRNVNSAARGLRRQAADLQTAIALIGFREVRNLALTVYVARLVDSGEPYDSFTRSGLWRHLVAAGEIARAISRICRRGEPEEAYLAGLLHDTSALLVDQYMNHDWRRTLDMVAEGFDAMDADRTVFTFLRSDLSAFVARKAGLPDRLVEAIAYHQMPERCRAKDRELLFVLTAANYFAEMRGLTALGVATAAAPADDVWKGLGLRSGQMAELLAELQPALDAAAALAEI